MADLGESTSDHLEDDLVAGRTADSQALTHYFGPASPAVILFGFATEEQRVDLPASVESVVAAMRRCDVHIVEAHASAEVSASQSRELFLVADRIGEVWAVTEAISREAFGDVAVVVPDNGPYEEAFSTALGSRGLAVQLGRQAQVQDVAIGRWLNGFLQSADDAFARPLMVDLLHQLAIAGALDVDAVTELDRISRVDWVIDARHWWVLYGNDRVDPSVGEAIRVLLAARAGLSHTDSNSLDDLYRLIRPLDPDRLVQRFAISGSGRMTNRSRIRRLLSTRTPIKGGTGLQIVRLSEAFGLAQSTVFVVGFDTTATYRASQSAADISTFKAKRRAWVWLTAYTSQLIVTAPAADLATGDRLEVSAWARSLGAPAWLPPSAELRSTIPGTSASDRQVGWLRNGPVRSLGIDLSGHRWSPSQIDTFQRCPLQWMLKSRLGLPRWKKPETDAVLDPATRGTIVHQVLEEHFGAGGAPFEQLLREAIIDHVAENALRDGDPLIEVTIQNLAVRIRSGHDEIERELAIAQAIEQQELEITASLRCGSREAVFAGKIDRLIDSDAGRMVLDYKSSKRITTTSELSNAPNTGQHLQLWLYAAMLEAVGEQPAGHVALAFPLADPSGKQTRVSRIQIGERQRHSEQVLAGIERLIALAESEELSVAPQGWDSACRYCDVADACPARHRKGPSHRAHALFRTRR